VVFELTLSSALLVVAALTTKSIVNLRLVQPGFRTSEIMTGRVTLSAGDSAQRGAFFTQVEEEIRHLAGALSSSLSSDVPGPGWSGRNFAVEGTTYARPNSFPAVRYLAVTPGFFTTFDVRVVRGRQISDEDRLGSLTVAVVNQRFVERFFPNADPIGHRLNISPTDSVANWVTIVGVIPNLYASDQGSINRKTPWPAEMLTSFRQQPNSNATIAIRVAGDPTAIAQPLRALVARLNPDLPVYSLDTMNDVLAKSRWDVRIFGGLFVIFGVVALALASIGLYAVLAFAVSRREREMGIRMALGAAARDVLQLVVKSATTLLAIGITLGVAVGIGIARLAGAVLFEVTPSDPAILAIVVGTLAVTGFVACVVPAMRATRSDPVRSLRVE
jgi:predicted permease